MGVGQAQRNEALDNLRRCATFRLRSAQLSAQKNVNGVGRLPREFHASAAKATYVVYDYETPIAWIDQHGHRIVPDVRYSTATSNHQAIVRQAWSGQYSTRVAD